MANKSSKNFVKKTTDPEPPLSRYQEGRSLTEVKKKTQKELSREEGRKRTSK
jgi:hypothetical protein